MLFSKRLPIGWIIKCSKDQFVNHPKTIGTLSDAFTLWICSRKAFISAKESRDAIEYTNMNPFLGCGMFPEFTKKMIFNLWWPPRQLYLLGNNFKAQKLTKRQPFPVFKSPHPILDHFWYINLASLRIGLFQLYPTPPMLLVYCLLLFLFDKNLKMIKCRIYSQTSRSRCYTCEWLPKNRKILRNVDRWPTYPKFAWA